MIYMILHKFFILLKHLNKNGCIIMHIRRRLALVSLILVDVILANVPILGEYLANFTNLLNLSRRVHLVTFWSDLINSWLKKGDIFVIVMPR